jgi:hypothetical protein
LNCDFADWLRGHRDLRTTSSGSLISL